jgi:hypothetical protein
MLTPYYSTLMTSQIAGPTLTSSTSFQSMLPLQAKYAFPSQFFQFIGQQIRIRAAGTITTSTSPGTLTFEVTGGPSLPVTTVVFTSGAMTLVASLTTVTFIADLTLTVRALDTNSASGLVFMGIGFFQCVAITATVTSGGSIMPQTSPTTGTAIDNTVSNFLDVGILSSTTATTLICQQYQLDAQL